MTDMMDEVLVSDRVWALPCKLIRHHSPLKSFMSALLAEWKSGQLEMVCKDLPASFTGDAALIRVALRNLIANALQHSPATAPVRITVQGTPDGSLVIGVTDEGAGIPTDEIPKLFQKYFRGRLAQGKPGAGLGLYLVQSIAVLHGGTVQVSSTLGSGSRFVMHLPTYQTPNSA